MAVHLLGLAIRAGLAAMTPVAAISPAAGRIRRWAAACW